MIARGAMTSPNDVQPEVVSARVSCMSERGCASWTYLFVLHRMYYTWAWWPGLVWSMGADECGGKAASPACSKIQSDGANATHGSALGRLSRSKREAEVHRWNHQIRVGEQHMQRVQW